MSLKLNSELFFINTIPVMSSMKWTYDSVYKGTLFTGIVSYQTLAKVKLNLGFDLLGVEEEKKETNFLQDNQANDRIYGGLEYVF